MTAVGIVCAKLHQSDCSKSSLIRISDNLCAQHQMTKLATISKMPQQHLGDIEARCVDHQVTQEPQLWLEFAVFLQHHLEHGGIMLAAVPVAGQHDISTDLKADGPVHGFEAP